MAPTADGTRATRRHLAVALLGLGAFGFSLAGGAWLYLLGLARPVASAHAWALPVNVLLFGLFAAHHSVLARPWAKAWLTRFLPAHLERSAFVWVASFLFLAVCVFWQPVAGVAWQLDGLPRVGGYALQLAGALVALDSARMLDLADLAGVRQVRAAMQGRAAQPHTMTESLTRRGAYRWVRHPIYSGWLLMTVASPDMTAGRLAFAVISSAYLALAIPWEERSLAAEHGEEYRQYAREVRWRMVPGLY